MPSAPPAPEPSIGDESVHAAIDIGTNSLHLVVARRERDGSLKVLTKEKEMVRLGSGAAVMKWLSDDAMDRALGALGRMRRIADSYDADLRAVATSAVREADNRMTFVRRAQAEAGVEVEIISGLEEARLIHLGMLQEIPVEDRRTLVIDIGGGSTELLLSRSGEPELVRSLRLGAIRLTDRFFAGGIVEPGARTQARRWLRSELAPVARAFEGRKIELGVGCSGTIETLARIALGLDGEPTPGSLSNVDVSADELRDAADLVLSFEDPDHRLVEIDGLEAKRADIICGGAALLSGLLDVLEVASLTISESALREGALVDQAGGFGDGEGRLSDIRRESLVRFGERYQEDADHVGRATDLALELFDATLPFHSASADDRNLLEAAGLVHNVGAFVSHAAHHKHSHYLIRHTDMLSGFSEQELGLIALVARYHRKSHPQEGHPEFAELDAADRDRVRLLAGLLRVGIALDRTRAGAVSSVAARRTGEVVEIEPQLSRDADASVEVFAASERLGLLAEALSAEVRIVGA